jgi:retron-type reverse transcriptase
MAQYYWHEDIITAYGKTLDLLRNLYRGDSRTWLQQRLGRNRLEDTARPNVSDETPDSIVGQFYTYMPGHSFKVEYTIDLLEADYLLPLDSDRAVVAVVDIGCGGATASTALINWVLKRSPQSTRLLFVGIDTNRCAVQLYDWMMQEHCQIPHLMGCLDYHAVIKGMPEALTYIAEGLYRAKRKWGIPSLNDLWIIQSNVVRPLQSIWQTDKRVRELLGMDADRGLIPDDFGDVEARAYEQLLQLTEADRMIIMTIATKDKEKGKETQWQISANTFGESVIRIFSERGHKTRRHTRSGANLVDQLLTVTYANPEGSYWHRENVKQYSGEFYADIAYIESERFHADQAWQEIISIPNLQLAWARVRAAMMREVLVDEIGLKLFEARLQKNLQYIRNQLLTYTNRLTDYPRVFYRVPKDEGTYRPRALQAIEEEILGVAVIQVLGKTVQELMSRNYGYRLEMGGRTEYLYRPWFRSYGRFRDAARKVIFGSDEGAYVLRGDIKNFYPSISQEKLLKAVFEKFHIQSSSRAAWLIRQLIIRHENDRDSGILQGPLASGFWANLYLLDLDRKFSDDYRDATLFRYVDDMVFVVRSFEAAGRVREDLIAQAKALDLELSPDKTDSQPESVEVAKEGFQKNKELDNLDKRFRRLTDGLYFTTANYRSTIATYDNGSWWNFVSQYQRCLAAGNVYVENSRLSRKLWQYVQDPTLSSERRVNMPDFALINHAEQWAEVFAQVNPQWTQNYVQIKQELSAMFRENWLHWKNVRETLRQREANLVQDADQEELQEEIKKLKAEMKKHQSFIGFSLNRLSRIGFDSVLDDIVEIFCYYSYILKSPRLILEHLALQGHAGTLDNIFLCLQSATFPGASFIRAVWLRSISLLEDQHYIGLLEHTCLSNTLGNDEPFIEALMASETLLFLQTYRPSKTFVSDLRSRASEVGHACLPLVRNLLMLTRRYEGEDSDYDLEQWREEMNEVYLWQTEDEDNSEAELLDSVFQPEPNVIRNDHYYSRYPDNADEFEGDYF